jgi:hypothetical protein
MNEALRNSNSPLNLHLMMSCGKRTQAASVHVHHATSVHRYVAAAAAVCVLFKLNRCVQWATGATEQSAQSRVVIKLMGPAKKSR